VRVPALRERREDIPRLAQNILERLARENGLKAVPELEPAALAQLQAYAFPGNVRELENVLERAVTLSDGQRITAAELRLRRDVTAELPAARAPLDQHVEEVERRAIRDALEKTRGNKTRAAALLGMTFRQLRYKVKKLNLE
jgi:two-component system response regulator PilR (NtrC family)